jgi:ATP-binding cassette subfamily B protein
MTQIPANLSGLVKLPHAGRDEPDQRPVDMHLIRRLIAFTRPYARTRNWLVLLVVIRSIQFPALGWAAAAIISGPIAAHDMHATLRALGWFVALVASTVIVFHFRIRLSLELAEAVIHDLRQAMLRHLLSLPLGFFHKQRVGSLISRLTSDLEAVRVGVKDVAFVGIVQLGCMLGAALVMLYYDWQLFLLMAALVPMLSFTIGHFRAKLFEAYREQQASFSGVTAIVAESIGGIRVIQGHVRGTTNSAAFQTVIDQHAALNMVAARRAAVMLPLLELNAQLFLAALLAIGGYRALHGGLAFDALLQFFFLSSLFFNPIAVLGNQYNQALTAMAGAERVFGLLDAQPDWTDAPDAKTLGPIAGKVELRNVSFGYNPQRAVLHDIELRVEPGQTVALVGATGSGKTSLLNLISKFYPPTSGQVLIDDHDLSDVRGESLRAQLGCVLQQNFLFSGSVLDNIRVVRPDASDASIFEAARVLDVLDLIEAFPAGWHTRLGEQGIGLSLGQRQIVCFTRAMLANPRLLLLDEATSAVDALTEQRLQSALARLLEGRTSFVVAHRLSTIRHADQVLVMDAGRIIERGTHSTLMAKGGAYHRLYRQFLA